VGVSFAIDQPEETRSLVRVFGVSLVLAPWVLNWLFQGLGRMLVVATAQALRMTAFALLVVAGVSTDGPLWHIAAAEIVSVALMALYYLAMQAPVVGAPRLSADAPRLAELLRQATPIGLSRMLWALSQYAGTVILAELAAPADVAWYGAAHRLVSALGGFVLLYHFNLFPALVEAAAAGAERLRAFATPLYRATAWLGAVGGLFGVLFGAQLCVLLYGAPFAQSGDSFGWLVWSLSVSLVGAHGRYALLALGHQRLELISNATGAAVSVVAALALVPGLGARGGAISLVAGTAASALAAHRLCARDAGVALPGLALLIRPALACAAIGAGAGWLPIASESARGAVAVAALVVAAPLLDPALRSDALRLLRARGVPR
jgi:O-antigen/teichoic acid export membrane protein